MTRKNSVSEYQFADVVVDTADFRVRKAGELRKITPLAFKVLLYLIEHRGRVIEKQEIFEQIWPENFVSDNALTRVVKEIRQVIGDEAGAPRFIETVPKRGYRFIAEVAETSLPALVETAAASAAVADSSAASGRSPGLNYLIGAAGLLIPAVILFGGWFVFKRPDSPAAPVVGRTSQITKWSGLDNFPDLSPDGNLLAYSSDQSGNFEIYVKPLASDAREIQITTDGSQNFQPAFSPDGQRLAFHSKGRGGIWIVPVSGGAMRQLTGFGAHPSWSPDGRQIAFQSGGLTDLGPSSRTIPPSTLWVVPADGGDPRPLTQAGKPLGGHGAPRWSPDGQRLVFNVEDSSSIGFWSIRIADGRLRELSTNGFDPVYAADGKRIFYSSLNGLWQLPISSTDDQPMGEPSLVSDDGPAQIRHLRISADGKKIIYAMMMSKSNLTSVSLDQKGGPKGPPALFLSSSAFRNATPAFSPDGRHLIYISWQTGSRGRLMLTNPEGQNPTEIAQNVGSLGWFSDSKQIGYISQKGDESKFCSINSATRQETVLYTFKSDVDFAKISPDGKEIVFNSKENGVINVWRANLENGEQKQLTFDAELAGFPIWSPDGQTLALQIKRGDDTHIALIPAAGGEMVQLTNDPGQSWIHSFSTDGDKIIFAGQRGDVWNVYSVSRTTREQKKLTGYDRLNTYVRYPAWSPRNDQVVFEYAETTGNIWLTELK